MYRGVSPIPGISEDGVAEEGTEAISIGNDRIGETLQPKELH